MKKNVFAIAIIILTSSFSSQTARAQNDERPSPLKVSGYLETYYVYDWNKPENNTRPAFLYSFNRHNEVNLNVGFVKASYTTDHARANLALMAGTYANANLAAEPGVLKNIFEANAGVKISSSKDLWIDAGIFGSHIGFESAVGKDCWNMTRSIQAENSPYYEAGIKISYTSDNGKWFLSGLILNGWQRIQRMDGNSFPSFGTQITFKPTEGVTLNSSSFIGTDSPDSARLMRYFHNFYGIFQLSETVGIIVGVDYGIQEQDSGSSSTNDWMAPIAIARFTISDKITVAVRGEYYDDKHGVMVTTTTPNGFRTTGISANLDYQIASNVVWRIELRNFNSKDKVFVRDGNTTHTDTFAGTSLAVSF